MSNNRRRVRTIDYLALQQTLQLQQKTPAPSGSEEDGNGNEGAPPDTGPPPVPPIRLRRERSVDEDVAR